VIVEGRNAERVSGGVFGDLREQESWQVVGHGIGGMRMRLISNQYFAREASRNQGFRLT
jgi:hypothetical protein